MSIDKFIRKKPNSHFTPNQCLAYGFLAKMSYLVDARKDSKINEAQYQLRFEELANELASKLNIERDQETCNWRNNKGTGLWECHYGGDYTSDCGLEWNMSNKDSPSENEMHFCPKCGKKLVEVQPPSEVQDD